MKKVISLFIVLISIIACLNINAIAEKPSEEIQELTFEATKGNLDDIEDTNWHKISLSESGCAVVYFKSAHARWNGYTYSWYLTVYDTDKKTVIKETGAKGAPGEETIIPLGNLEAGDYYLKVGVPSSANPLMSGFSTEPYEVSLFKVYHSTVVEYPESRFSTVSKAGEIIYSYGQNYFLKLHDGEATAVLGTSKNGAIVPFLFSEDEEAVEYMVMSTGRIIRAGTNINKDLYYSDGYHIEKYTDKWQTKEDLPLFLVRDIGYGGIEEVLDEQEHQRKVNAFKDFFKNNRTTIIIISSVIVVLIIICLIILGASKVSYTPTKKSSKNKKKHSYSNSNYSSTGNYNSSTDDDRWREIDDMRIANQITENLNTPGYDPESFSSVSDTESFGPPSDM